MTQDWAIPQNAPDWVGRTEKRLSALERRSGPIGDIVNILGPAQNSRAILIEDWNDPLAANNGYFWSKPGALHAPDGVRGWTGSIIGRTDNSGMQEVWNTDDLNDVLYYMRTFTDDGTGQGRTYSDWRSWATPSGLIELPDLGDTIDDLLAEMAEAIDDAAVALSFFEQDDEPVPGVSGVPATIKIGSVWVDTNDNRHTYSWDGTAWVSIESTLFAAIEAELVAQQAAIEAAAEAASDAMDFAETLNKTYRQTTAPTNPDTNGRALVAQDNWFDTDDNNRWRRWDGAAWVVAGVGLQGPYIETDPGATAGIKISTGGIIAYNGAGSPTFYLEAATGAIGLVGTVTVGGTIDGAVVTGGTLQTEATAARGIKLNSSGMTVYDGSGGAVMTIVAATGAVTINGALAAIAVTGATVTGGTLQTTATAARGIKITSTGLIAYDNSGVTQATLDGTTGVLTVAGGVLTGGSVTGAIVTGGTLQSEATAARGIKINSAGMIAYNTSGVARVTIDAATGDIVLAGNMTGGGTITGPVFRTASSGERIVVRNDGSGGIIESFSGLSGETAGYFDPAAYGSRPTITIATGVTGTYTETGMLTLRSGTADNSELLLNTKIFLMAFGSRPGTEMFRVDYNGGDPNVDVGTVSTPTDLHVSQDIAVDRDLSIGRYGSGAGMDTWQVACSSNANPTGTTNVTIAGLSQAVSSPGTSAVYLVTIDADWSIVTAGSIGLLELLVDGTAQTAQMVIAASAGVTIRGNYSQTWRITGLSSGSHTFTARTRNTAGSTSTQVNATNSKMTVRRCR